MIFGVVVFVVSSAVMVEVVMVLAEVAVVVTETRRGRKNCSGRGVCSDDGHSRGT